MKVEVGLQLRRPFAHALVIDLLFRFHIPGHADGVQTQFIGYVERAGQMKALPNLTAMPKPRSLPLPPR